MKWKIYSSFALLLLPFLCFQFDRGSDFVRIPVVFCPGSPWAYVEVDLEGNPYLVKIDTGATELFTFNKEVLEKVHHKKPQGIQEWVDVNGNSYHTPTYLIDLLHIGKIEVTQATVKEEEPEFLATGSVIRTSKNKEKNEEKEALKSSGCLGACLFRKVKYWFLDFPSKALFAMKDVEKAQKKIPFSLEHFAEVRLENFDPHIVIAIKTDFGTKTFALDTGASRSVLRDASLGKNHHAIKTERFLIGETNFGPKELYLFDFSDRMEFDGFLGQDFLKDHAVFLDFKRNKAFIGPTSLHISSRPR